MKSDRPKFCRYLLAVFCLTAIIQFTPGAANAQQQRQDSDEVVRINTDLVQTAVTVVDKKGHFVDGLSREQFELLVDGQPRPISFFERVTAGSARESQLATRNDSGLIKPPASGVTVRGRTIVFFIDDMHLSPDSLNRTRQMLRRFLENEMMENDSVAITSASGQIGFLQQFTHQSEVLNAAIERLNPIPYNVIGFGTGSTVMTEYLALDIDGRKSDDKVLNFYVEECMKQTNTFQIPPTLLAAIRATCTTDVKSSARAVLMQAGKITQNMYASLDSLLRSSARAPGRKLVFLVSDGFLMDVGAHGPDLREKLDQLIDAARRSGSVIYTIHAQGLVTSFPDVSNKTPVDPNGRLDMAKVGEVTATQDALHALADETGGRALRNTNYFDRWVSEVLDETSNYYLVAWRPDKEEEKAAKFRQVKIRIVNRPELSVFAPRGYVNGARAATKVASAGTDVKIPAEKTPKPPEAELRDALADYYPRHSLPTILSLTYLNTPANGMVLTSSIQLASNALSYGNDGKQPANVQLAGVVLNDKGKIAASFKDGLKVNPFARAGFDTSGIIYNHRAPLGPGIYQVRVAARDEKSGQVGSATEWVAIPDLARHQLTLSSLLLGGQTIGSAKSEDGSAQIQLSVDHRFARSARLSFWAFVYNAASPANLLAGTEVLRHGQVILVSPKRRLSNAGSDPERIPFGDELSLQSLAPGRYDLRVTVTDNVSKRSVSRAIDFEVQ
jgi:VWFA-related protein